MEDQSPHRRVHLHIDGHVQGVGFRYTAISVASSFAVTGFVMNAADGGVELVAEGAEPEINRFLDALRRSSVYRHVRSEHPYWSSATGEFTQFGIRYY